MIEIPLPLAVTVLLPGCRTPRELLTPTEVLLFAGGGVVELVPGAGARPPPPDAPRAVAGTSTLVLIESRARAPAIARQLAIKSIGPLSGYAYGVS